MNEKQVTELVGKISDLLHNDETFMGAAVQYATEERIKSDPKWNPDDTDSDTAYWSLINEFQITVLSRAMGSWRRFHD